MEYQKLNLLFLNHNFPILLDTRIGPYRYIEPYRIRVSHVEVSVIPSMRIAATQRAPSDQNRHHIPNRMPFKTASARH